MKAGTRNLSATLLQHDRQKGGAVPRALPLGRGIGLGTSRSTLLHSSLLSASLPQIQRGDVDLVDVAQSVARIVQLLQEFIVAQPFFQWLVGKAAVAGKEKPFPVRR